MSTKTFIRNRIDPSEIHDRSLLVPEKNLINYSAWTEGETKLALLAEQANILASFYPEDKEVQKARGILIDTLYKGLHRAPMPTGFHSGKVATVVGAIRKARKQTQPANGQMLFGREGGIGGGIGDPLIPMTDCSSIINNLEGPSDPNWSSSQALYQECAKENKMKKILNEHLEKSSHHLLYEFVKSSEVNNYPATVAVKAINHRIGTDVLHQVTKLSRNNIRLWMRNGVMRHNVLEGLEPLPPEDSINLLRNNPKFKEAINGIGVVETATIALIIAIAKLVGAIAAAITAAAGLIMLLKKNDSASAQFWQQTQGIGTETWGPGENDWQGGGEAPPGSLPPGAGLDGSDQSLPLLLIGGGLGLFLLLD